MRDIKRIFAESFNSELFFFDEPMSRRTSLKIGGAAAVYFTPDSVEVLMKAVEICRQHGVKYYILGRGSNVLFSDSGFSGVVISISGKLGKLSLNGCIIEAQSGVSLSALANFAMDNSLAGLEFASGIPGALGGALFMNAGAYGGELKDLVIDVHVLDSNMLPKTLSNSEMEFGYRSSIAQREEMIILSAKLNLTPGETSRIKEKMFSLNSRRREKQPLDLPSAGSAFKRPEGHFAGKLIMDCGLRGFSIGGAQISEKHCGFIVNRGGASCGDVTALIKYVSDKVYQSFSVKLEPEIRIIGD